MPIPFNSKPAGKADSSRSSCSLATNPTFEGEATSAMLARELKARGARVTRIARGIPSGGEIVHMNGAVLAEALRGRSEVT